MAITFLGVHLWKPFLGILGSHLVAISGLYLSVACQWLICGLLVAYWWFISGLLVVDRGLDNHFPSTNRLKQSGRCAQKRLP